MGTRAETIGYGAATAAATDVVTPLRRAAAALVGTDPSAAQAVLRLVLGGVMLPHGLQKAFGLFGGYGFEGTMGFLTAGVGLPWLIALLVVAIELVGSVALIAGLFSRAAALGVLAVMIGATVTTHLPHGFFMNWNGTAGGEGFEFHLLVMGMALVIVLRGSGALSLDRLLSRSVSSDR